MERPKPAAFDSIFASYRPRNRPRLLFFLVKMNNFHSTDPGCWMTAANRSRKVKRDAFQIVNYRWEPVQKLVINWNTLERDQGRHYSFFLSFFSFSPPLLFRLFSFKRIGASHFVLLSWLASTVLFGAKNCQISVRERPRKGLRIIDTYR